MKSQVIEISPKTIFITIAIIFGLFVAWQIKGILLSLVIAYILMSGFAPLVDWFEKEGVNKTVAVLATFILIISVLGLLIFAVIPPLIVQTRELILSLPQYIDNLDRFVQTKNGLPNITIDDITQFLTQRIDKALTNVLSVILNVFTGFLTFITVAVFSFYLLLERDKIKQNLFIFFPHLSKERVYRLGHKIEEKLGAWLRGQVTLMLLVGAATWLGLTILGIKYALPLAVVAGILEIVPIIGPIISAVPAIIIAFVQNPVLVIAVIILYVVVQQVENYLLVPKVMERAVGLSPLIIIFALLVGGSLLGIIGALLAVPVTAIIQVILEDFHDHPTKS
ncbi:MAG: hypothetical protein A2864_01885 [Candidatus Woykebacteria bacterium RIFCSPHIGHO2_01_FULL_39_12]|uniref:AI-2E family transporter n=1 Tax=Candidatus Woykebacteria bacterium RIFCSPHIGHO2_01_FULL_39_12 TaxID=1802599 RepID=A0A1G1WK51_9BACT|nr:MAG: hypothetical protein A2864_01885 [Candidatus Woykebacteria bacterium RIFCSPHIGHO2_01_FULL_39_12]